MIESPICVDISRVCNIELLSDYCSTLEKDPYIKEGFRFKNIARYKMKDKQLLRTAHDPLFQSAKYNPVHGDIIRHYPEISRDENIESNIKRVVEFFFQKGLLSEDEEMLVQLQRITCNSDMEGYPAVEGWHRDGKSIVGMFCISRFNVSGGDSQLRVNLDKPITFNKEMQPGEILLIDDRKILHYVTPLKPIIKDTLGYRDIMLISTPSSRPDASLENALVAG